MPRLTSWTARFALAALAVLLSGCFHITSLLTVRPDGSATLRDEVVLSGFALMALQDAAEEGGEEAKEMFAREDVETRAAALGEGVRLVSLEPADDGYVAVYAVDDVRQLRYSTPDLPSNDAEADDNSPIGDGVDLSFAFEDGDPSTLRIVVPKPERAKPDAPEPDENGMVEAEEDVDPAQQAQMMTMLRSFFGDARMTVQVAVDGDVVETNAAHVDGSTVTVFDLPFSAVFDVMDEDPELMKDADPEVVIARLQEVEGVRLQGPGTVRVRFQ